MKKVVAIIIAALLVTGCGEVSETVYRTKAGDWTRRLAVNARSYNTPGAFIDAYQIQAEMEAVKPPTKYKETHKHLQDAIGYYIQALLHKDNDGAMLTWLELCKEALTAATGTL